MKASYQHENDEQQRMLEINVGDDDDDVDVVVVGGDDDDDDDGCQHVTPAAPSCRATLFWVSCDRRSSCSHRPCRH